MKKVLFLFFLAVSYDSFSAVNTASVSVQVSAPELTVTCPNWQWYGRKIDSEGSVTFETDGWYCILNVPNVASVNKIKFKFGTIDYGFYWSKKGPVYLGQRYRDRADVDVVLTRTTQPIQDRIRMGYSGFSDYALYDSNPWFWQNWTGWTSKDLGRDWDSTCEINLGHCLPYISFPSNDQIKIDYKFSIGGSNCGGHGDSTYPMHYCQKGDVFTFEW